MMDFDLSRALSVAEAAARDAGELIVEWIGRPRETAAKSSPHDLVTEVDKACQQRIEQRLMAEFPKSSFLGEESVAPGAAAAERAVSDADQALLWVVDPIDGTLNFIQGIPLCVVSIGLVVEGAPALGVIYDPVRDEMFSAQGGRATLNGQPMRVSGEPRLANAVLASGLPNGVYRERNVEQIRRFGNHARNVRALGSAALALAYVACGRLDGFWENDLNAWDLCAGMVLVQAAGGAATDVHGAAYTLAARHAVATNGLIHGALLRDLDVDDLGDMG